MSSPLDPNANPYSSPTQLGTTYRVSKSRELPGFPKTVFIIDLCFCLIRAALVIVGLIGYFELRQQEAGSLLLASVTMELLTGAAIVMTGLPGNAALLSRNSWGVPLAWLCALATLGNFVVGLWQIWLTVGFQAVPGTPEFIGFVIGVSFVGIIRLGLLALYVAAVVNFSSWNRGPARRAALV